MFERFTSEARDVVVLAQEEATGLGHNYIGTEHLLLGLLAEERGVAGRVLASLGLRTEAVRSRTDAVVGRGTALDAELNASALAAIGIDLDEVRRRVEEAFGPGALERAALDRGGPRSLRRKLFGRGASRCGDSAPGHRPFTRRAKKVLELALREALVLGHRHIGTEHILLGLLREGEGIAVTLLKQEGLTPDRVREAVLGQLAA
jgi:ATP-dependent Clp protease ATP-binding subunit ClpA